MGLSSWRDLEGVIARASLLIALAVPISGCASWPIGAHKGQSFREQRDYMAKRAAAEASEVEVSSQSFDEKLAIAKRLHRTGQVDQAMRVYFDAFRLDPEDPRAHEGMAYLQLDTQSASAERVLQKVAAEYPDLSMTQVGLGLARYAQGDLAGAVAPLERAIELSPESADAHDAMSVVLARLDRFDEALRHGELARTLGPYDAEIANNLGVTYLMSGNSVGAEGAIREAIALDGDRPAFRNNLGIALSRQGRFDEAMKEFRSVGSEQAAHNNLAYLHFVSGRLDEAIHHYEKAVLAEGDDTVAVLQNLSAALDARFALHSIDP